MHDADYWIENLRLLPHPEGGAYAEQYRSVENLDSLPERFNGPRAISTAIYFLLRNGEFSSFHKIRSDEIWHFYEGGPLKIIILDPLGNIQTKILGLAPEKDWYPQIVVSAGQWFAAEPMESYTLVGCTVAPGFDFCDFELASRENLTNQYPDHKEIILSYTRS